MAGDVKRQPLKNTFIRSIMDECVQYFLTLTTPLSLKHNLNLKYKITKLRFDKCPTS